MNFSKVIVLVLFLATCLLAEGVYVETLDEQKNSNNLLVLRVRIFNNTPITLHDALLKYCLVKSPNKTIEIENFYIEKSLISQYEIDSVNTCVEIKIGDIPQGFFPNQDGFSIGIHYSDWSPRNKSLDFSNPQSSKFTKAENVALYIDDSILYGSDVLSQKNSDEDVLPDAAPLSAFDGGSVVLSPNEPYRFVWNYVDLAEKYQLTVLREDSSLVHSGEYFTNVADVRLSKGHYLWNVQSVRFNQKAKPLSSIKHYNRLSISGFRPSSDGFRVDWPDTIISTSGRKDTRLLNVIWGDLSDYRKWDTIHEPADPITRPLDEDEGGRCWAIGVYNLNHHYRMANGQKGNVTLDEIVALGHMYKVYWNDSIREAKNDSVLSVFNGQSGGREGGLYMLQWALNIPEPRVWFTDSIGLDSLKNMWIDSLSSGTPIYVDFGIPERSATSHIMLVDGYRYGDDGTVQFHFINTDNYGTNEWRVFNGPQWHRIYTFVFVRNVDTVRGSLPEVHADSDSDGVMDFDEMYRFQSDYRLRDTDGDGIDDKTEIYSYVMREKMYVSGNGFILPSDLPKNFRIQVLQKETYADIDGDGKRAENDDDSDDDGVKDGEEDLNYNGFVDEGETDPFYKDVLDFDKKDIPDNVIIYSSDYVRINNGVVLYQGASERSRCYGDCSIMSEGKEGASVIVGVKAAVGSIYSKGAVWVQNQAVIGSVRYYAKPHIYETMFQDVFLSLGNEYYNGRADFNEDESRWPWHIPEYSAKVTDSNREKIVKSGECDTLKNNDVFKKIKVEAGGILYFDEGEIIVNDLQLDAGSRIAFVKPGFSTILHVNEKIQWNSSIANQSIDTVASSFKLYYYGEERYFVHGVWAGTLIAPNAKLVLGQTQNKEMYGQFLGKGVSVHQYSKVFRVLFHPKKTIMSNTPFNVAWIGGHK